MKKKERQEFLNGLKMVSVMRGAGIQIAEALRTAGEEMGDTRTGVLFRRTARRVEEGEKLHTAFKKEHMERDELLYTALQTGEESGALKRILQEYVVYRMKMEDFYDRTMQGIRYPVFVIFTAVIVLLFMLLAVIPSFKGIYAISGGEIPELTKKILAASDFLSNNIILLTFIFTGIMLTTGKYIKRLTAGSYVMPEILYRVPYAGKLYKQHIMAAFCRNMHILLQSGVRIAEAMTISAGISSNQKFKSEVLNAAEQIRRGKESSSFFTTTVFFDTIYKTLYRTGERSGEMEEIFRYLGEHYTEELDKSIQKITSILEPVLILLIGGIIAVILAGLYLPLFESAGGFV